MPLMLKAISKKIAAAFGIGLVDIRKNYAQDGLFSKEIRLGLFGKGGFKNAAARATNSMGIGKGNGFGMT